MLIARRKLFEALGLPRPLTAGQSLAMANEDSTLRASVGWGTDGAFHAEVSEAVEGENGLPLITMHGSYRRDHDGFDLTGRDDRTEASDRLDIISIAAGFRMLTQDLGTIG